jgi:hypothetical protein
MSFVIQNDIDLKDNRTESYSGFFMIENKKILNKPLIRNAFVEMICEANNKVAFRAYYVT